MTSSDPGTDTRRLAVVVVRHTAASGAPPGIDPQAFAAACLADSYEVLADLVEVTSGVVGTEEEASELLWPGSVRLDPQTSTRRLVAQVDQRFDEVVFIPADVPDLPGLVLAKVFKALQRADVCLAPARGLAGGLVAIGVRAPWPSWISIDLDLDHDPAESLAQLAPRRTRLAVGQDWHRMRGPGAVSRLDPGLEGWEMTRSLLSGRALDAG